MREMMGLLRRDIAAHRMAYAVCLLLGMLTSNEMALSDSRR